MDGMTLLRYWILFGVSNVLLGAGTMMFYKAPPGLRQKVSPLAATTVFVVGMTMMLVYGTPDLLLLTIQKVFPQ